MTANCNNGRSIKEILASISAAVPCQVVEPAEPAQRAKYQRPTHMLQPRRFPSVDTASRFMPGCQPRYGRSR